MATKKMKAIVATGYGSPEVLKVVTVDRPTPKSDELLIKVKVSSATRADTMMRTGKPYIGRLFLGLTKPKNPIPGTGFSGVVEKVGEDVTSFKKGDAVFGETTLNFSANAEYLVIKENGVVHPLPNYIDFEEAANFCDGHVTSYNFLKVKGKIEKGQKVLINGASGALGTSAIQIAKHFGAHVTAVCSEKNEGLVKSLGADIVINYNQENFTKAVNQYDIIYDTVGKSSFRSCKAALTEKGLYLSPVLSFSLLFEVLLSNISSKKKAIFEATGTNSDERLNILVTKVMEIYKAGGLKTFINRQFPLEKLAEAHRYIDSGHKRGNVIILNNYK